MISIKLRNFSGIEINNFNDLNKNDCNIEKNKSITKSDILSPEMKEYLIKEKELSL